MKYSQFTCHTSAGALRELLIHLVLAIVEAFVARGRNVIAFVGQLDDQIDVGLPHALPENGQCLRTVWRLGNDIETLLRPNGGRDVRCIHIAHAIVPRRCDAHTIVVVRQKVRIEIFRPVFIVQSAFIVSVVLPFRYAFKFHVQLRIVQFFFENL